MANEDEATRLYKLLRSLVDAGEYLIERCDSGHNDAWDRFHKALDDAEDEIG